MSTSVAVPLKNNGNQAKTGRGGKYLSFHLGAQEFGIQVLKVREIIGVQDITSVPQTPGWIKGVLNLRGKVIAVIDLRVKFGMPAWANNQRTCIVVAQVETDSEQMLMGLIVDQVSEVANISSSEIEDAPSFGSNAPTPYILGMAKQKGKVKILLEIDQVLNSGEWGSLQGALPREDR